MAKILMSEQLMGVGVQNPEVFLRNKDAKKVSYTTFLDIICCPLCHNDLKLNKTILINPIKEISKCQKLVP